MEKTTTKKKSMLSGLKSMLVVEDETTEETNEESQATVAVQTSAPKLPGTPAILSGTYVPPTTSSGPTQVSDQVEEIKKMRKTLESSIENSSSAFDYPKYRQALNSMKAVVADEVLRFKTAFITAQTLKVNKADVIKSAKDCLSLLETEKTKFDTEIKDAYTLTVVSQEKEIVDIDEAVASKLADVKKLNDEVASLNLKKNEVQATIFNSKKAIEASTLYFTAAHSALTTEIQSDIDKMSQYLEG